MHQMTGYIGRATLKSFRQMGDMIALAYRLGLLSLTPTKAGRCLVRRATLEQIYFTGVQALPLIVPIALIVGSMLIIQFAQLSNQYNLGKMAVVLIIREIGPIITAIVVILRSATAVTVEISYMNVLKEIEALEMAGIDPLRMLCLPRLAGITAAMLCLFVVFDLVAILGGYAIVWTATFLPLGNFLGQIGRAITVNDITVGFIKAVCFAIIITVTCLHHGFQRKRRITAVPVATSRAAIACFFYCLVANVLISAVFYS